jgi:hypothetical protein
LLLVLSAVLSVVLSAVGCAHVVHQDARVAVRARAAPADQAVAIFHGSLVCSFTIRDLSGELHDEEERRGGMLPVTMTRAVPDSPWWIEDSARGANLVTVIAMPPGRYELVSYTEARGWQEGTDENGQATGLTNCPRRWRLDRREAQLPFEIRAGEVTLLPVPGGTAADWVMHRLRFVLDHVPAPDVREMLQSWKPGILNAEERSHAAFLARIRQVRDGYDVYPACNGHDTAAVVASAGTPFPWYGKGNDTPAVTERFRRGAGAVVPAQRGSGFGASCVDRRGAFQIYLSSPNDLNAAVRAAGEWMVREGMQGEIDLKAPPITFR